MKLALQTLFNLSKYGSQLRETLRLVGLKLYLLAFVFALTACASNQGVVFHSFGFDLRYDNQDAEMLDYRYGDSKSPSRAADWAVSEGTPVFFEGVTGTMRRGDFLYAKWRIRSSQKVYEDTVDLRNRLPANIADHRIVLMINGSQLWVYLVAPDKRSAGDLPNGPQRYRDRRVITLYPDQAKQ